MKFFGFCFLVKQKDFLVISVFFLFFSAQPQVFNKALAASSPKYFVLRGGDKYFTFENNIEAATAMRNDALSAGVDIYEIPDWTMRTPPPGTNEITTVHVTGASRTEIPTNHDFLDTLRVFDQDRNGSERITVLLVFNRFLSVDETANLLESDVRFLKRFWCSFIATARADCLLEISKKDYFFWQDRFKAKYKLGFNCPVSPSGVYIAEIFPSLSGSLEEDLECLDIELVSKGSRVNNAVLKGEYSNIQKALELPWVHYLNPAPIIIDQ